MSNRGPWVFATSRCLLSVAAILGLGSVGLRAQMSPPTPMTSPESTSQKAPRPVAENKDEQERLAKCALDTDKLLFTKLRDDGPLSPGRENMDEYNAYNDIVLQARQFPLAEMEKNADGNILYRDFFSQDRDRHRFKLFRIDGRLLRLREIGSNVDLEKNGVAKTYEAWVFPEKGDEPFVVIVSEIPAGLEPNLEYKPTKSVRMTGYFFRLLDYQSAQESPKTPGTQVKRRVPFLIGHSFSLAPTAVPDTASDDWYVTYLPAIVAGIGGLAVLVFGLTWWFRRDDQTLRAEHEARRERNPFHEGSTGTIDS